MILQEKKIILKDGKECILRSLDTEDAEQLLEYLKKVSIETDFLIRYPEEITMSIEDEKNFIKNIRDNPKNFMISAFIDKKLVGNAQISCVGERVKLTHRAGLGMAIIKEAWNVGLGTVLLSEMLEYARQAGFEQVELEVVTENQKAIQLYEKLGFRIYGTRKNAFKLKDGTYYDEYLMMKILIAE